MDGPRVDLTQLFPELKDIERELVGHLYLVELKVAHGCEAWGGAGVIIADHAFVSDDRRCIRTRFPSEVAWFFDRVKGIAYKCELIDFNAKFQFFAKLASVVQSYDQLATEAQSADELLSTLLEEVGSIALKWAFPGSP